MPGEVQCPAASRAWPRSPRRPCLWSPLPRTTGSSATCGLGKSSPRRRRSRRRGRSSSCFAPTCTAPPACRRSLRADGRCARLQQRRGSTLNFQFSRARGRRLRPCRLQAPGRYHDRRRAFAGLTLDEATDHGALFRHLGYWSDGRAVFPPIVGDDLSTIPRVFPANGLRVFKWALCLDLLMSEPGVDPAGVPSDRPGDPSPHLRRGEYSEISPIPP